jgi:hypothetical protein
MLIYDTLDKLAESCIPNGIHKTLHVNCREAWVETVVSLYEAKSISLTPLTVKSLLKDWEILLYKKYSILN